jgi:putative aldouronate transport system permease protein
MSKAAATHTDPRHDDLTPAGQPATRPPNVLLKAVRNDWQKYLMLAIPMAVVFVFSYMPMYGLLIAFKRYNIMKGILGSPWVGLDNFIYAFTLPRFGRVVWNTLLLNLLDLAFSFPAPILFAILLSEMKRSRIIRLTQTISYLPHFLSAVIIGGIAYQLLAPSTGTINRLLAVVGLPQAPFLVQNTWWMFTYTFIGTWQGVGYGSIVYIAAITSINPELYEAATVDGVNRIQRIWHVTLPCLRPTIVLFLILSVGGLMSIGFERPYVLGNSIVADVAEVISVYVFNVGLGQANYSLGTVFGLFQSIVGAVLVLTVNQVSNSLGEQGLW